MYHNYRWYHNYSVSYNVLDHTEIQSMCVIYRTHGDPLFRACRKSETRIRSTCPAASYTRVSQHMMHCLYRYGRVRISTYFVQSRMAIARASIVSSKNRNNYM